MKKCKDCGITKALDEFYPDKGNTANQHTKVDCIECEGWRNKAKKPGFYEVKNRIDIAANNYISGSNIWNKPITISGEPDMILRAAV